MIGMSTSTGAPKLSRVTMRYVKASAFPVGAEGGTPAVACCLQAGKTCRANAADWNLAVPGHPWADLKFEMTDDNFRFQYDYTGAGATYT